MRCAVGITLEGDGGYRDHRKFGKFLFQIVILRFAFSETQTPAVVVNRNGYMIWIIEGGRAAIERGIVEPPLRRGGFPDQLGELAPVFLIAKPPALCGKIKLVPIIELGFRRRRHLVGLLAADQVAAHRHCGLGPLRPKCGDDVDGPCSPVEARKSCLVDLERVHKCDRVRCNSRRLSVAEGLVRKKARPAVAAQIGNKDAIPRRCQQGGHIDKAVNVVGPAVQKDHGRAIGRTGFGIADIQDTGLDLLQRRERCVRAWLDFGQVRPLRLAGLRIRATGRGELERSKGDGARG